MYPQIRSRRFRLLTAGAALTAVTLIVAGCGDSDAATTTSTGAPPTTTAPTTTDAPATTAAPTTTAAAPTTTAVAGPEPVVVTAVDYDYVGLPDRVAAGTRLILENDSAGEAHELVVIRLPDDETRSVEELVQLPPEELAAFFPNVKAVLLAAPESSGFAAVGNGTLTEPGRYAVICAIPTGADPNEYLVAAATAENGPPEVAGGPPHIVNGMFGEITVEG
jgi:hypothetical protein